MILFAPICVGPLQLLNYPNDWDRKSVRATFEEDFCVRL